MLISKESCSVSGVDMCNNSKHALAKALYDNKSEAPDELAFKKGDRIIVIEQNTSGLEGWWLCSLNGRQGIAPGNRLQIIPGVYDNGAGARFSASPQKVVTPNYVKTSSQIQSDYDVPPNPRPAGYSSPPSLVSAYDTLPSGNRATVEVVNPDYDVPPAAKKCLNTPETSGFEEYDVPRSHTVDSNELYDIPKSFAKKGNPMTVNAPDFIEMTYDIPVPHRNAMVLNTLHNNTSKDICDGLAKQTNVKVYQAPDGNEPDDTYDTPPSHGLTLHNINNKSLSSNGGPSEIYDTPASQIVPEQSDLYDTPSNNYPEGLYDTPPPSRVVQDNYDTPVVDKFRMMKLNGHQDSVYDVPPQVTKDKPGSLAHPSQRHSVNELDSNVSLNNIPTRLTKSVNDLGDVHHNHLNLDRDAAMDLFVQKQQTLDGSTANFLSYVSSSWRTREALAKRLQEIRSASEQVRVSFKDVIDFGNGALSNAAAFPEIKRKILKEFQPLLDSHSTLYNLGISLDEQGWDLNKLVKSQAINMADELDKFVFTTRNIHDQLKRLASVITIHSAQIFKRSATSAARPLPQPPASNNTNWVTAEKEYSQNSRDISKVRPLPDIPPPLSPKTTPYNKIIVPEKKPLILSQHDLEILNYYRDEIELHSAELTNATSLFFTCIEEHLPPKIFVAHSKHVILTGHKMVFIGDTLHHNVQSTELRNQIIHCSDLMCECLNTGVTATKTAALQFPAVQPLQEMVDKMTDIEAASNQLKSSILRYLHKK